MTHFPVRNTRNVVICPECSAYLSMEEVGAYSCSATQSSLSNLRAAIKDLEENNRVVEESELKDLVDEYCFETVYICDGCGDASDSADWSATVEEIWTCPSDDFNYEEYDEAFECCPTCASATDDCACRKLTDTVQYVSGSVYFINHEEYSANSTYSYICWFCHDRFISEHYAQDHSHSCVQGFLRAYVPEVGINSYWGTGKYEASNVHPHNRWEPNSKMVEWLNSQQSAAIESNPRDPECALCSSGNLCCAIHNTHVIPHRGICFRNKK